MTATGPRGTADGTDAIEAVVDFARHALTVLADRQRDGGVYRGEDRHRAARVEPEAAVRSLRQSVPMGTHDGLVADWHELQAHPGLVLLDRLALDDDERLAVLLPCALEAEPSLGPMVACLTDLPSLRCATVHVLDAVGLLLGAPRHAVRRAVATGGRLDRLRLVEAREGAGDSVGDRVVVPDEWLLAGLVDGRVPDRPDVDGVDWVTGPGARCSPHVVCGPVIAAGPDPVTAARAWAGEVHLTAVAVTRWGDADPVPLARQCLAEGSGLLVRGAIGDRLLRRACDRLARLGVAVALHDPGGSSFPTPAGWRRAPSAPRAAASVVGIGRPAGRDGDGEGATGTATDTAAGGDLDESWLELAAFATRLDTAVGWDDLVLLPRTEAHLRELAGAIRSHGLVMDEWGFGHRPGATGINALFNGPSGTGKTLAARALATEAGLALWMVDLARVTDKYLGENEKHLDRVLTAAAACGAMLLFDEAESVFGRRGETREARDRWANLGVAYLLQRIEQHPGVTVLTTNLGQQLDPAFERRIAHRVEFALPDEARRRRLWRTVIPVTAPLEDDAALDVVARRFELGGGAIRNAALNAAYAAASDGSAIALRHLVRAATRELAKSGAALTRAELGDLAPLLDAGAGS